MSKHKKDNLFNNDKGSNDFSPHTFYMLNLNRVLTFLFSIFFFVVPLVPDIQVIRPKLFVIEILLFLGVSFLLIYSLIEGKICVRQTNFFVLVLLMSIYIVVRHVVSLDKAVSFVELKRWVLSFVAVYLISVVDKKFHKWLLVSWLVGSGLSILYGYLQHSGGIWIIQVPQMDRVMSMFGNPIFFAVHIVNYIPLVLGLIFISGNKELPEGVPKIKKVFLLAILVLSLVVLYYTKTRAAFIGLIVGLVVFVYLNVASRKKVFYVAFLLLAFLVFVVWTKDIWLRQQAHFLIWRDTLSMWWQKKFFGIGMGKFHSEFSAFASEQLRSIWPKERFIVNDAHNEYIQILAETGMVGLLLFLVVLGGFFYFVFKRLQYDKIQKIKKLDCNNEEIFVSGLLGGMCGVLMQNFFSVDMRFIISSVYLFITMGLVVGRSFDLKVVELRFLNDKFLRTTFIVLVTIFLGIISFDTKKKQLSFLSAIHFSPDGVKISLYDSGNGVLQNILRPYLAELKLSKEPDFFDEKILDKERTLSELLELRNKFPKKAIIYEKIAWVCAKEKQFDKAIENYLIAVQINPTSFAAYNNLGNIMFLLGNRKEAIRYYIKSIEINPSQIDARLNLGIAYYYEGDVKKAVEQFNEVLSLDPKNEKAIIMLKKMRE